MIQNIEPTPAALAFDRFARVRQHLQFRQNKARHDQRTTKKTSGTQFPDASVDDGAGIHHQRFVFQYFAGKANVGYNEREFISITSHRQHHSEIGEDDINNQPDRPLRRLRLESQNLRTIKQTRKDQSQ